MRFIFMDEAGTSAREPVTVVVGLIADADKHVMEAERLIAETLRAVPPKFQKGFVFHAMDVLQNSSKYGDEWSLSDRLSLLKSMMAIPKRLGMAVCVSATWRSKDDGFAKNTLKKLKLTAEQLDHVNAAALCVAKADRFVRNCARPNEVAAVVAEDVPEMRKYLKELPRIFKNDPQYLAPEKLRKTEKEKELGYQTQSGDCRVERIRNSFR